MRHPRRRVFLFAFQAELAGANQARIASHMSVVVSQSETHPEPIACLSTTTIGTRGLQVFRHDIVPEGEVPGLPQPVMVPSNLRQVLRPIWPTVQPSVGWLHNGSAGVVSDCQLDQLSTWGDAFPMVRRDS